MLYKKGKRKTEAQQTDLMSGNVHQQPKKKEKRRKEKVKNSMHICTMNE
jgi:hypothetical protein